jgi:hypothetical protein
MVAVLGTALSISAWFVVSGLEDRTSAAQCNLRASDMARRKTAGFSGRAKMTHAQAKGLFPPRVGD